MSLSAPVNLKREMLVSASVNAAFSAAFFLVVFGAAGPVPVWGAGNYAFDFVPQSFAVAIMGTLVPGFLARRALRKGSSMAGPVAPSTRLLLAYAAANALGAILVGVGLGAAVLYLSGAQVLAWTAALALKVCYGALLGALVTWVTLVRMFEPGRA